MYPKRLLFDKAINDVFNILSYLLEFDLIYFIYDFPFQSEDKILVEITKVILARHDFYYVCPRISQNFKIEIIRRISLVIL